MGGTFFRFPGAIDQCEIARENSGNKSSGLQTDGFFSIASTSRTDARADSLARVRMLDKSFSGNQSTFRIRAKRCLSTIIRSITPIIFRDYCQLILQYNRWREKYREILSHYRLRPKLYATDFTRLIVYCRIRSSCANAGGTYPISPEIPDKHVLSVRDRVGGIEYRATLEFRVEAFRARGRPMRPNEWRRQ